ncbi:hypothetical protein H1C71_007482, partial [Ictidomys tridecemlineatus]
INKGIRKKEEEGFNVKNPAAKSLCLILFLCWHSTGLRVCGQGLVSTLRFVEGQGEWMRETSHAGLGRACQPGATSLAFNCPEGIQYAPPGAGIVAQRESASLICVRHWVQSSAPHKNIIKVLCPPITEKNIKKKQNTSSLFDLCPVKRIHFFFNKYFLVVVGHNTFILFIYFYVVLRIEPSVSHMLEEHSTAEPHPQPHEKDPFLIREMKIPV